MPHYNRNIVITTFRALNPDELEPTEAALIDYDEDLFNRYDQRVRTRAAQEGIPITNFNVAILVCFAALATPTGVGDKVRDACTFFKAVRPTP